MKKREYIYLDNAATSFPKPAAVAKAVARAIDITGGSPGRGGHKMALSASRIIFEGREIIANFFGLTSPERIVFTKNTTEGINLALRSLLKKGDSVATSGLEHNSVVRPVHALGKEGIKTVAAPLDKNGFPDPERLPDVTALIVTAASNVTGAIADLGSIGAACSKRGILFIVDAAQAAGSVPLDVTNVDVLVCAGHKALLGPQGTGFVWFSPKTDPQPFLFGGTGSESASAKMPDYWPDKFEAGTPNTPGVAGLVAGIRYIEKRGIESIRQKEVELVGKIMERFLNDSLITVYPPFELDKRASLVCFNIKGRDPSEVENQLDKAGFALRSGLHCAPAGHRFMGTYPDGAVRVSPGPFTTKKEIDFFFKAINEICGRR